MKGSVLVLLVCSALFFAAPSHSYSVTEDELASSQDEGETGQFLMTVPPVNRGLALSLFRQLSDLGFLCLQSALDGIQTSEFLAQFGKPWDSLEFTRDKLIKWLKLMMYYFPECLMLQVADLNAKYSDEDALVSRSLSRPDEFATVHDFLSSLTGLGKAVRKCVEEAIKHMEETSHGQGGEVQRAMTDLMGILSMYGRKAVPDTVPTVGVRPPRHDLIPAATAYKKRYSPDKPRGYRYINPSYPMYPEDPCDPFIPQSPGFREEIAQLPATSGIYTLQEDWNARPTVPQSPGFREEIAQLPATSGIYTLQEDWNARPIDKSNLLHVVLQKILSKGKGKGSAPEHADAAPAEGLRFDDNGATGSHLRDGGSPDYPDPVTECPYRRAH